MKKIFLLMIIFALFSCSKDSNPTKPEEWQGNLNSYGFPDISGTYSFTTNQFNWKCSDGSVGSTPAVSFNLSVVQLDGNTLQCFNTDTTSTPQAGYTLISSSGLKGTVEKAEGNIADFLLSSTVIYNVVTSTYVGEMTINNNIDGEFTNNSWEGNFTYTMHVRNGSCEYSTTFRGIKLTNKISTKRGNLFSVSTSKL